MSRLTPLGLSILTLVIFALVLAVLTGRAELVVVTVPLLIVLLRATRAARGGDIAVAHAVSAARVVERERVSVTVTVTGAPALPLVELIDPLGSMTRLVTGRNHALLTLGRDGRAAWTYEIECMRRGPLELGRVHVRLWDRAGLRAQEIAVHDPKLVRVYPRTVNVRRLPRPRRTQTSVGNYVAATVGEGLEPGDIRPFGPGDRIRHINWRASRRWQRLYVTQYQEERNADVVLMLDSLAEFGDPPGTTLDHSIRAAASLAAAYLARKDRVGFIEYGGFFRSVRPGTGRRQYERVLDALHRADVLFTYVTRDIALVPKRVLPPQALVVAITPLLERRFEEAVMDLAARGFDVVILSPSPIALVPRGTSRTTDLACRFWAIDRRTRFDALRRLGLPVVEWDPTEPLDLALDSLARLRRQRVAR